MTLRSLLGLTLAGLLAGSPATADDHFRSSVQPLLRKHCYSCHGPTTQKSGLRLDRRAAALAGGEGGTVIVPSKADESELLRRVKSTDLAERMPPQGAPLRAEEIGVLRKWIEAGAEWPESAAERSDAADDRLNHWAWQPVRRPAVPAVPESADVRNPIDHFVEAARAKSGLTASPQADRRTLIRRLSFDLRGLPPTSDEVTAFAADPDPRAYEELVDRYLATPAYGERWARHWLDIAHYADTHGFERDQRRDNAWHYRDYVIRAFNRDRPYDEFLKEQIAGDVLRPDDPEAIAATGFLAAGPWDFVGQVETGSPTLRRAARADDLDDLVTQVLTAACGITINCARCHDHKIDPISQREYYGMWAVFAGLKRGERVLDAPLERELNGRRAALVTRANELRAELARLTGDRVNLADIVGGGDGRGSGRRGQGIDVLTGRPQNDPRPVLEGVVPNRFAKSSVRFIDGVVVPVPSAEGTPVSSTGLRFRGVAASSGQTWDAIRNGPVNNQFTTNLGGVETTSADHSLLGLHANGAITFDLDAIRAAGAESELTFTARAGYFGQIERDGASWHVLLDGEVAAQKTGIGRLDGLSDVRVAIPAGVRFLTLVSLDNGNGIGHDQIGFVDPHLVPTRPRDLTAEQLARRRTLETELPRVEQELQAVPTAPRIYAMQSEPAPAVHLYHRGNPEDPKEVVLPASLRLFHLEKNLGDGSTPEGERRKALAEMLVDPAHPLTRRVLVNRLWHHHFGVGLVDTPSDFGLAGGQPSHPELLDWLAEEFLQEGWSIKAMHRLICTSATYRQSSAARDECLAVDAQNRLLWRMSPRRLEAEALHDAVLQVSGRLNPKMGGPGYEDFRYTDGYAPVYDYRTADRPELWRRSVYRFVVRTTAHEFMTALDCPNPANLTPARNLTTTPIQSLALLNNDFILRQSRYFAEDVAAKAPGDAATQVRLAFRRTCARDPSPDEAAAAERLAKTQGLFAVCRMLLNSNEFIYVD